MNIPRFLYYVKEIDFKLSCSYGPGRYDPFYEEYGIDYPIGYVRWTEKRNMEAFLELLKEKRIDLSKITTHTFPFADALKAYDLITGKRKEKFIGILLAYDVPQRREKEKDIVQVRAEKREKINIGLIGAGSFAQSMILPFIKGHQGVNLEGVLVAEGHMSQNVAKKFGISQCYSDPGSLFQNDSIDTVIIATRHDLHAPYILEGLKHRKHIYVEKPLALKEEDVKKIIEAHRGAETDIMLGFNRRFAPFTQAWLNKLAARTSPMLITYRINAGFIPGENWIQNREEGGGRIIGEVCHFVDLCRFLCGEEFKSIFAQTIGGDKYRDNLSVLAGFRNGSLASINYISSGDKSLPKERIEIFCQGSVAVIEDFKTMKVARKEKLRSSKGTQDKGHKKQISLWLESLKQGHPIPVPFKESVEATIATFMIHESLNTGKVIRFDEYSKKFME
jgi:polar amino acid transport system substrate-binding protein